MGYLKQMAVESHQLDTKNADDDELAAALAILSGLDTDRANEKRDEIKAEQKNRQKANLKAQVRRLQAQRASLDTPEEKRAKLDAQIAGLNEAMKE